METLICRWTIRSNTDKSTTRGDVAIVILPPLAIRGRLIARLDYVNINDSKKRGAISGDDLGGDVGSLL